MDCWYFAGAISTNGYGVISVKKDNRWRQVNVHRVVYENTYGDIPVGLVIDHTCRTRCCINPSHLQAITNNENLRLGWTRNTHCKNGHEWAPDNTYIRSNGARRCKTCNVITRRNNRHKKKLVS